MSLSSNSRNGYHKTTPKAPRRIEDFEDPKEFLMAIHDAIQEHQKNFIATGRIHGNINTDTVCIGSRPGSPNIKARGFLADSPIANPKFQSVNILSKSALKRKSNFPIDYLDDIESFYYIIAWVSMAYSAPGVRLHPSDHPFLLSCWAAEPNSRTSALEKEAMLFGDGFACNIHEAGLSGSTYHAGHIFESLLECFHTTLKERYNEKLLRKRIVTAQEMLASSYAVYEKILWHLKVSVHLLGDVSQ